MDLLEQQRSRALAGARAAPGWEEGALIAEPALPVLASPSWRGVDGAPWRVTDTASGKTLFVKIMDPDAALTIDLHTMVEATRRASDLGIGPRLYAADTTTGVLVMENLGAGWRVGTLDRLLNPAIVDAVIAARRAFQAGPPLPKTSGVFAEIETFFAQAMAIGAQMPPDAGWLVAELRFASLGLQSLAISHAPIHGDGNVANVMIGDHGEIRLIDWDRATTADPLEDWGSFLVEAFEQEPEARDAFARAMGGFDERLFNRARLYGIADDLRWGLIGAVLAKSSPCTTHEFYKFASWRFLRCRMAVRAPRFGDMLRRLA